MDINKEVLRYAIEAFTLKSNLRFMEIVNYVWDKGIDCRPQTVANILHWHCINHSRLSREPYFYKIEQGLYRLSTEDDIRNEELLKASETDIYKQFYEDISNEAYEKLNERDSSDKQLIISEFTKDLITRYGLILDHSNKTYIRFSTDRLDSIVGMIGEGWSKRIKRLLLFEIENREYTYTLKLLIGPGNAEIREKLYNIAKNNTSVYNKADIELTDTWKTIYSNKFLNKEQLNNLSIEQIKNIIEKSLEDFLEHDLNRLYDGFRLITEPNIEYEILNLMNSNISIDEIKETEKIAIIKSRIGHGQLKKQLVEKERCCKICGLSDERFLIASHIKPWSKSNNQERLDLNNVLLLCPHHDSAFDQGYITFDEDGMLIVSNQLSFETKALLNLAVEKKVKFTQKQHHYISWHRNNIFSI